MMRVRARWILPLVILLTNAALISGCGDDDGPGGPSTGAEVPSEFWGVWEDVSESEPCFAESGRLFREAFTDTIQICPDSFFEDDDEFGEEFPCNYVWSDGNRRLDFDCEGSVTFAGCTTTFDFSGFAVLNAAGDEVTYEMRQEIASVGDCEILFDDCTIDTGTLRRLSTSVEGCDDDGGNGSEGTFTLAITGSGGASSVDFTTGEGIAGASLTEGGYFVLGTKTVLGDGTATGQSISIIIPEGAATGSPITLTLDPVEFEEAGIAFGELRSSGQWTLVEYVGSLTLTAASSTRLAGTFSGEGVLQSLDESGPDENIGMSGTLDLPVVDIGQAMAQDARARLFRELARPSQNR